MQAVLAGYLAILTLICPLVCGAAEPDTPSQPHPHAGSSSADESHPGPLHCPDEGGSCLCLGAIRASGPLDNSADSGSPWSYGLDLAGLSLPTPWPPIAGGCGRLAGSFGRFNPAQPAPELDRLQSFRC
jgi:hypothetical protein